MTIQLFQPHTDTQELNALMQTLDSHWLGKGQELARYLREKGIYTSFRYFPLHYAYQTGDKLPNAEWAAEHTLNLPLHNNLTMLEINYICGKVKEFFER